jgi:hypothetical protein
MSLATFYKFLLSEGYGDLVVLRSPSCISLLDHDLEQIGEIYRIVDRERTEVTQVWLESTNWEEARDYYLANLQARFLHLIADHDDSTIARYENQLAHAGIEFKRNDVPGFHGVGTVRCRLFVRGRDLKRSYAVVGTSP